MKVYVLMSGFYDNYGLSGVFATQALAEKYISNEQLGTDPWMAVNEDGYWRIQETEVVGLKEYVSAGHLSTEK
jgi:hypothetical protein